MSRFVPQSALTQNGVPNRELTEQEMIDQNFTGPVWDHLRVLGVAPPRLPLTAEDAYISYIDRGHGRYMQWDKSIKKFVIKHNLLELVEQNPARFEQLGIADRECELSVSNYACRSILCSDSHQE
jgi:hypothetical protein